VHEQIASASTKSGVERTVDLAAPVVELLRGLLARRREESLRAGRGGDVPPWVVFPWLPERPDDRDEQKAAKRVRRAMEQVLRGAKLPARFTPHSLRHTFCSLLIGSDVSPVYVQQQAGHASVKMTVDVYGSWFAVEAPGAMDRLARGMPSESGNNYPGLATSAVVAATATLPPTGTCGNGAVSRPSPG
jgi:integrase